MLLLHLVTEGVLPFLVGVVGIKIVVFGLGDKWGLDLLIIELVPVVVLEPGVLFYLFGAIQPQS